ncbi:MAG: rhodanese-like domain-containing protein [Cellvibrionaceae bacterium]
MVLVYMFAFNEIRGSGEAVTIHAFTRLVNDDSAQVVDLREAKEYREGHIVDTINIPYAKLDDQLVQLKQDKIIILVDKMGQHTGPASKRLKKQGYTVARLKGGIMEWRAQNLPLVAV